MADSCTNSTICYNSGVCQYDVSAGYDKCLCKTYYDSSTWCNTTIFDAYQGLDLIYSGIGIILYAILLMLYVFESVIDIMNRKFTPILMTKGILITFVMTRLITMSLWTVSSTLKTAQYARISALFDSIGTAILISANILIIVSWLEMVLKAKALGDSDITLLRIKRGLFIAVGVVGPLNILALIVAEFVPQIGIILGITPLLLILVMIASVIISIVYLVRIHSWIKEISKTKAVKKVLYRAKWVKGLIGMLVNVIFFLLIFFVIKRNSPVVYLVIDVLSRSIDLIIATTMFFFLENATLKSIKKGLVVTHISSSTSNQSH